MDCRIMLLLEGENSFYIVSFAKTPDCSNQRAEKFVQWNFREFPILWIVHKDNMVVRIKTSKSLKSTSLDTDISQSLEIPLVPPTKDFQG